MAFSEWHQTFTLLFNLWRNPFFYLIIILSLINILGEAAKWKLLIRPKISLPFFVSIKSVLRGISTGILTPGRIGEIGGRVMSYQGDQLSYSSIMFVVGSLFQTGLTMVLGFLALFLVSVSLKSLNFQFYLIAISLFTLSVTLVIYCIKNFLPRYYPRQEIRLYLSYITSCSPTKLFTIGSISILRYALYSFQLYLALILFNPTIPFLTALPLIFFFYFGITFLPGFVFADLGIRGSIAVFLFGTLTSSISLIVIPVFFLWILNNCIPALVGLWFLLDQKDKLQHSKLSLGD